MINDKQIFIFFGVMAGMLVIETAFILFELITEKFGLSFPVLSPIMDWLIMIAGTWFVCGCFLMAIKAFKDLINNP